MATSVLKTGGKITSVATGDLGNADTSYTYFVLAGEGEKNAALNWTVTATTLTLEFTNEDTAAGNHFASASAADLNALTWVDRTLALTGAATQTTAGSLTIDTNFAWKLGRIKRVTTNATNVCSIYFSRV